MCCALTRRPVCLEQVMRAAIKDPFHGVQGVHKSCKPNHPMNAEFARRVGAALWEWHQPRVNDMAEYLKDQDVDQTPEDAMRSAKYKAKGMKDYCDRDAQAVRLEEVFTWAREENERYRATAEGACFGGQRSP